VQIFTFILTDLFDFEAEPIKVELESEEKAGKYGFNVASELLKQMPDLGSRGMCVLIRDDSGKTVSIVQTASHLQSRRFVQLLLIRMRMRSGAVPVRLAAMLVGG
jgi:hypothetical protein